MPIQKGMYRRNMSVVSDQNTTLLKRPSRIYRAAFSTITCLELGDCVAAQLATKVPLALMVFELASWTLTPAFEDQCAAVSDHSILVGWPFGSTSGKDSPQS